MNNCEEILTAAMAAFDGEETGLSTEELDAHLENCEGCRREIAAMQSTFALLGKQERRAIHADLWSQVEPRIVPKTNWQPFAFLGVFLVAWKLAEMLSETDLGFGFKIVPLVVVVALFGFLKENPFKINTELILEK